MSEIESKVKAIIVDKLGVDEAEVKKAETEAKKASVQENIALKKLEYMENVRNDEKVVDKEMRRVGIALIVIGIIAMFYFSDYVYHRLVVSALSTVV